MRPDRFEIQVRIVDCPKTIRTSLLYYVQLTSAGRIISVLMINSVVGDTSLRFGITWVLIHILFTVGKKNQLDVTFCILYFSSNSCSTCFGQPCAHVPGWQVVRPWTHYLPTGLDNLPAATAYTNRRL